MAFYLFIFISLLLCGGILFCLWFFLFVCFKDRDKAKLSGQGGEETLEGIQGEKNMIRMYCIKFFQ